MGRSRQEMPALSGGGNVYGSYVHGIFDAPGIADTILRTLCAKKGVSFDALATFDTRGYKGGSMTCWQTWCAADWICLSSTVCCAGKYNETNSTVYHRKRCTACRACWG